MKTNTTSKQDKKFNKDVKHKNTEQIDETFRHSDLMSKSMSAQSNKSKPRISILAYIKNIIKSIFFKQKTNKYTTYSQTMNNSEYFLSSQSSSLEKSSSMPSLQSNTTKLDQDNDIDKINDNNTNISLTFSTFGKETKNSIQKNIAKNNRRRSSYPTPPIRTSSLEKSNSMPSLQSNTTKLDQDNDINKINDNNTNISLTFSTFGKEIKNSIQKNIAKNNGRRSSYPTPPIRTSSLDKGKDKNNNIRR